MQLRFLLLAVLLFCATHCRAQDLPDSAVDLGATNTENGLSVPSDGDGRNAPEVIGGISVRRTTGEATQYLYVKIENANYTGPRDLWVTVEAFDDGLGVVGLQYDKAAPQIDIQTRYSAAPDALFLTNSQKWRTATFYSFPGFNTPPLAAFVLFAKLSIMIDFGNESFDP